MWIFSKKLLRFGVRKSWGIYWEKFSQKIYPARGIAKIFKKYMKINHFLLLSWSVENYFLVEWSLNYSTRWPWIVFLSSILVLFWKIYFTASNDFPGNFYGGGNLPDGNFPRGQLSQNYSINMQLKMKIQYQKITVHTVNLMHHMRSHKVIKMKSKKNEWWKIKLINQSWNNFIGLWWSHGA